MIEVLIPTISFDEQFRNGYHQINFFDINLYRNIYKNFDELVKIFSNGDKSKIFIISNVLDINLNDKKTVNHLYKEILNYVNRNERESFNCAINNLRKVIYCVQPFLDNSEIDVGLDVDEEKILQAMNIIYKEDDDFVRNLINYLKVNCKLSRVDVFITYNLYMGMNNLELRAFNDELKKLNICLIDFISSNNREVQNPENDCVLIDDELCII